MPFERPTLTEITERIIADIESRTTGGESLLRRSLLRVLGRVYAGAVHLMYSFLSYMKDQLFASTADSEFLELIGSEYSITRKTATYATGTVTVTGTTGITIPEGSELQSSDGNIYTTDDEAVISGGTIDIDITASIAGSDSKESGGVTLTFVSPLVGVNTSATVSILGITGGVDEEDDTDYRDRILTRKRQPPHGGSEFDYEAWALEVPGCTRAWLFPEYMGVGTVGLAFVSDNDTNTIIPDTDQRQEMYDYIIEHTDDITNYSVGIPVAAQPGFFVVDVSLLSLDFTIGIYPNNSTVQASVRSKLADLINVEGGPGETIYLSELITVISSATGIIAAQVISPTADIGIATNKVSQLGTVTFQDYI